MPRVLFALNAEQQNITNWFAHEFLFMCAEFWHHLCKNLSHVEILVFLCWFLTRHIKHQCLRADKTWSARADSRHSRQYERWQELFHADRQLPIPAAPWTASPIETRSIINTQSFPYTTCNVSKIPEGFSPVSLKIETQDGACNMSH